MIAFSEDWPKLHRDEFTTIRGPDKYEYYNSLVGRVVPIKMKGHLLEPATVVRVLKWTIREMTAEFIEADTHPGNTREQFLAMLRRWYKKRPWWKELDTEMTVVCLRRG